MLTTDHAIITKTIKEAAVVTPVRAIKNQYRGINAHLHSHFQAEGGWDGFHTNHITDLMRIMRNQLLPMGYIAEIEHSLQIRYMGMSAGKPKSDITIYDTDFERSRRTSGSPARSQEGLALSDVMNLDEELMEYRAIGIYEYVPGINDQGEPVAWIELLSPSNKPGGQDADAYRSKRLKLLKSGIVFVEMDYLHESGSTFEGIAPYDIGDPEAPRYPDSHPYHIIVVDPRPKYIEGKVFPSHFDVDQAIPTVAIPLNGEDMLPFDFDAAYDKTFSETQYGRQWVDYSQLPANFDRYSRADQVRILTRMAAILKGVHDGVDIEKNAPLPADELSYDDAIGRINGWE
jgi:uncharacterized protein DUF4058